MKNILWDIDGTLLNFDLAETAAIYKCFENYNLDKPSDDMIKAYKQINKNYWEKLEKGETTRARVFVGRFEDFFDKYGINKSLAPLFNHLYQVELSKTYIFNPHGEQVVKELAKDYDQFAVTNGSFTAQKGKLSASNLDKIFKESFISELIGFDKPDIRFFNYVFEIIGSKNLDDYVIIGDSLTSDMRGGINAGIKTIWYNPNNMNNYLDLDIDYSVNSLDEIRPLIDKIFS